MIKVDKINGFDGGISDESFPGTPYGQPGWIPSAPQTPTKPEREESEKPDDPPIVSPE